MSRSTNELKELLQRVRQTRKITNALYLLSSARINSDRALWDYRSAYAQKMQNAMAQILASKKRQDVLSRSPSGKAPLYIIVTGDKGLCGSYNNDIVRYASGVIMEQTQKSGMAPVVYGFGRACVSKAEQAGLRIDRLLPGSASHPDAATASFICGELLSVFLRGDVSEVAFIGTPVDSPHHKPQLRRILPLRLEDFPFNGSAAEKTVFEPDIESVFDAVSRAYLENTVFSLLMQFALSENTARMTAMKEATDKADERAAELEKTMNEQRQLAITNELSEISAAAGAQKKNQS